MKKRSNKLWALAAIVSGIFLLPQVAGASSMDSNLGITFTSPGKVLPDTDGKLPQLGDPLFNWLLIIGLLLLAFVLYRWWKRRRA